MDLWIFWLLACVYPLLPALYTVHRHNGFILNFCVGSFFLQHRAVAMISHGKYYILVGEGEVLLVGGGEVGGRRDRGHSTAAEAEPNDCHQRQLR